MIRTSIHEENARFQETDEYFALEKLFKAFAILRKTSR